MTVAGIVKSSLIDFPGLVSCVLFTPGCNYDCFYCQNRPLIGGPWTPLDQSELWDFLNRRVGQLDGVVVTGGEPTLQPDLTDFLEALKRLGYKVKLDTNGSSPDVVGKILGSGLADYFAVDYKAPAVRYGEICGGAADAADVLETIRLLKDRGADFEARTTVIPQLGEVDLIQMARELPEVPDGRSTGTENRKRTCPATRIRLTSCRTRPLRSGLSPKRFADGSRTRFPEGYDKDKTNPRPRPRVRHMILFIFPVQACLSS